MPDKPDPAAAVVDKIAALPAFNDLAARLHELILEAAPHLAPRLWYGMPGYAPARAKPVVCFFRVDDDQRVTFGITEHANLAPDPQATDLLIESAWFLTALDEPTEHRIRAIVAKAANA